MFRFRQFTIHQDQCAMKVGTDGTLLGAWADVPLPVATPSAPPLILDVGTGTGLIALMMAQRFPEATVEAIDVDPSAVQQASQNAACSPFASRVHVQLCDVACLQGSFDAIVCNPPYYTHALTSPDARRTMARHAVTLTYAQLMRHAWRMLRPWGQLSVVVPSQQKGLMESEAALAGFFLCRQCAVRTTERKPPRRFLLAFAKQSAPFCAATLTLGTPEAEALTRQFYL